MHSNIGVDQAHEQNNKLIKIDGGAISILDNPNALLRWAVAGHIVAQICIDGEAINETIHIHHEDTHSFEQKYRTDLDALYSEFLDLGNPFKEEESLVQLSSKDMMDEASSHSVKQASQKGKEKYEAFVTERLCCQDVSFYNNNTKNNLPLFRQKNSIVT